MRFTRLSEWLRWQERLHPRAIDLGLERARAVLARMALGHPPLATLPFAVVSVAGTNGKGSCVAFMEAMLEAAGYHVGAYFSPHLVRYNERVRIGGGEVDDDSLVAAFERVDRARGDTSLTYFEFATLAAVDLFTRSGVEVALLEVGLGGRLDAVNLFDADVALLTTVGLDHKDWLGDDRERIGWEKAGIFRAGRSAVCADPDPPESVERHARELGCRLLRVGRDYRFAAREDSWSWSAGQRHVEGLPYPRLQARFQLANAAAALAAIDALAPRVGVDAAAAREGLLSAHLPGRFQVLPGVIETIVDVAHNVQAAQALAGALKARPCAGRTHALVAMLADKDIEGVLSAMTPVVDCWHVAQLEVARGASVERVAAALGARAHVRHPDVALAHRHITAHARPGDRVIVFGSFHTVAEVLRVAS